MSPTTHPSGEWHLLVPRPVPQRWYQRVPGGRAGAQRGSGRSQLHRVLTAAMGPNAEPPASRVSDVTRGRWPPLPMSAVHGPTSARSAPDLAIGVTAGLGPTSEETSVGIGGEPLKFAVTCRVWP